MCQFKRKINFHFFACDSKHFGSYVCHGQSVHAWLTLSITVHVHPCQSEHEHLEYPKSKKLTY
jgi:hypothetical protein